MNNRIVTRAAAAVSALCLAFVATNEGTVYTAYPDQGAVWTICEGHTGPEVHKGLKVDRAQCDVWLRQDLVTAANAVDDTGVPLNDCQRSALVDFTFNVGVGAYKGSTLRRKLVARDYTGASAEFPKWTIVAGKPNQGVLNRRVREQSLYNVKMCPTEGPQRAALAASLGIPLGTYPALAQGAQATGK